MVRGALTGPSALAVRLRRSASAAHLAEATRTDGGPRFEDEAPPSALPGSLRHFSEMGLRPGRGVPFWCRFSTCNFRDEKPL
jgi:hypothetical protein